MLHDPALTLAHWFKATASNTPSGGCVQTAFLPDGRVALRDSKNIHKPPHIFTRHEWECFLDGVKKGEFDPRD
ncbi:MAG TPA: DUF397 domain-containing protein [Actinobacteria bacterium]|nr:DUF397 domain-containing protein [Actinomycetota bacterium]